MHTTSTRPLRSLLAVLAAASLALGAAACGDDDDPDASSPDTSSPDTTATEPAEGYGDGENGGGESSDGTIVAEDFSLTDLTVAPGAELVLDNQGGAPHTATADDGAFDTGQVSGGQTSEPVTAPDEPGSYAFHCEVHPSMTATLTVEG